MNKHAHKKNAALSKFLIIIVFVVIFSPLFWHRSTQAAPASITLIPERDKYVQNEACVNDDVIIVGKYLYGACESVLGFDLSQISGPVTSAVLKIDVKYSNYTYDQYNKPDYFKKYMNIYGSNTDDWSESDASVPSKDQSIFASECVDIVQVYSYDVTSFIQSQADGYATLVLEPIIGSPTRYFTFLSSDASLPCGVSLEINYLNPAATLSGSALNEDNVNGGTVNIALEDTTFIDSTLDNDNFTLTGGIDGLSVGAVNYIDDTHCALTLAYNGRDFDNAFSFGVVIDKSELTALNNLQTSNTLTVAAVNDAESLSLSDDGAIYEGAENGEVITVTLSGGQFSDTMTPDNWTLGNLPRGVSKGSVTRVNDHTVSITLSGNATADYDVDITNMSVSCTAAEYGDSTGGGTITGSTGVRFIADDNPETLTLSDNGDITEGNEQGKTFIATISGGEFADKLTPSNWFMSGQPYGCSLDYTIERLDDHRVRLKIFALSQVDYDTDITNAVVSCTSAEYKDSTGNGTLSGTGITFHATNDAETFYTQSYNSQAIYEGQEDGKIVWASLFGGKFPWTVNPAHWSVSGLPDGVSCEIAKDEYYKPRVNITLLGNATQDYDSDRTLTITCSTDGYSDSTGKGPLTSSAVKLTASNDPESISISDDGAIHEGAEDGEFITVTLTGGTFPSTLNPDQWIVANLPAGVTKGTVTRIDSHTVKIALSGNAQTDYDTDITDISVTCGITEYNDSTGGGPLTCGTGVRLIADNDIEALTIDDDGRIEEGAENAEVITATLSGGIFSNPINAANWTLTGLPEGVSKGAVTRIDSHHVGICLSGNTSADYDSDLSGVTVMCTADEYSGTLRTSLSASGVTLKAINDEESISIANSEVISEGFEDGKSIDVTLTGGCFAPVLTPANWTLGGLPKGVAMGAVIRVDSSHATIMLAGNSIGDYDKDITDISVTCTADEYMDNQNGGPLTCGTGVRFEAVDDLESLSVSDDGLITEGMENGEILTVTLTGGVFSETLKSSNWSMTGQPAGVSIGAVTRVNDHTAALRLAGTAEADYDVDITAARVVCAPAEYNDHTDGDALTSNAGVRFTAISDLEFISAYADITEGTEDGAAITVKITGGSFHTALHPENWSVTGLPEGVELGTVKRIDARTAAVSLKGSASYDYDKDISLSVTCMPDEYIGTLRTPLTASGIVLKAVDDPEWLTLSDSGIREGHENGETITVKIAGGQFVRAIDPLGWTVENLPVGVSVGRITRADAHTVVLTLAGKAAKDYDKDITDVKVTCGATQYDTGDVPLSVQSGVVFKATVEKDASLQDETQPSASPEPAPTPSPVPSGSQTPAQPSGSAEDGNKPAENRSVQVTSIQENKETGAIWVEFDAASLPDGTTSIRLANGTQIDIEGHSGLIQLKISREDLNERGELVLEALDDEGTPLAALSISVVDQNDQLIAVNPQTADNGQTLLWVILPVGIAAAAVAGALIWKKRRP